MVRREWRPRTGREGVDAGVEGVDKGKGKEKAGEKGAKAMSAEGGMGSAGGEHVQSDEDSYAQREWSPPPPIDEHQPEYGHAQQFVSLIQPPKDDPPYTQSSSREVDAGAMDGLSLALEGVSLGFVPRSVTKAKAKAKAASAMQV